MRWEPDRLFNLPPQRLCEYEAAIAANQAYMQSMENEWRARYDHLGRELDRIMLIRRESQKGESKGEKENNLLANDPAVRRIRNDYLVAQSLKTYLEKMGDSLIVVANGIKRAISLRIEEMRQSGMGGRHTA